MFVERRLFKLSEKRLRKNLKRSAGQIAKSMNVSVASIRTIFKNDLHLSINKMRKNLKAVQKHNRLERSKIVLGKLKAEHGRARGLFSDSLLLIEVTSER